MGPGTWWGRSCKGCRPEAIEALECCAMYAPPLGSLLQALCQIPVTNSSKALVQRYWRYKRWNLLAPWGCQAVARIHRIFFSSSSQGG